MVDELRAGATGIDMSEEQHNSNNGESHQNDDRDPGERCCVACGEPVGPGDAVIAYPGLYHTSCYLETEEEE